jgi:hypothetical protein
MSRGPHMVAPDGRTFSFDEWDAYLKEPGHTVDDAYVGLDGKVFDVDGFRFNVHGSCLDPHVLLIAPEGNRLGSTLCYIKLRTFRNWRKRSAGDREPVWYVDSFSINAPQISLLRMTPDDTEQDAIVTGLRHLRTRAEQGIKYVKAGLESARRNGITNTTSYGGELARYKYFLRLIDEQLEEKVQLTLF